MVGMYYYKSFVIRGCKPYTGWIGTRFHSKFKIDLFFELLKKKTGFPLWIKRIDKTEYRDCLVGGDRSKSCTIKKAIKDLRRL